MKKTQKLVLQLEDEKIESYLDEELAPEEAEVLRQIHASN
jgi:hypothetical protein